MRNSFGEFREFWLWNDEVNQQNAVEWAVNELTDCRAKSLMQKCRKTYPILSSEKDVGACHQNLGAILCKLLPSDPEKVLELLYRELFNVLEDEYDHYCKWIPYGELHLLSVPD